MRKIILIIIASTFIFGCQNEKSEKETQIKSELQKIIQEVGVPGINMAISMPDGEIWTISEGYSDKEKQILMKPEDVMFSGSTGKTFCAAIILQLQDEGKLNIDDSLSKYFGNEEWFAKIPNADSLTLRMLLNHTSGLERYEYDDSLWIKMKAEPDKVWTGEERLSFIFGKPALHPAGKGWAYSDTNYIILGMLIEKITGNDYYAELKKRFFQPLNLEKTFPGNSRVIAGLIPGYTGSSEVFHLSEKVLQDDGKFAFNPQMEFTGGGIVCTASDLAKWGRLYYSGKLFSQDSYRLMITPAAFPTTLEDNAKYGMACIIWNNDGVVSFGHTGFFPGYVTIVEYIPGLDICIAMQWNTDKRNSQKSLHKYLDNIKTIIKSN
jgi:D-alanyl-D-alanine carboxypeptidase